MLLALLLFSFPKSDTSTRVLTGWKGTLRTEIYWRKRGKMNDLLVADFPYWTWHRCRAYRDLGRPELPFSEPCLPKKRNCNPLAILAAEISYLEFWPFMLQVHHLECDPIRPSETNIVLSRLMPPQHWLVGSQTAMGMSNRGFSLVDDNSDCSGSSNLPSSISWR